MKLGKSKFNDVSSEKVHQNKTTTFASEKSTTEEKGAWSGI